MTESVFMFWYCDNIYEDGESCISLHRTEIGAKKAMARHKANKKVDFKKLYKSDPDLKFGESSSWGVKKFKIEN
jgi:hypothetical protein